VVDVEIAVPHPRRQALFKSGAAVPGPWVGLAMLDTGSCFTLVDPRVVSHLGLVRFGTRTIVTPHSGPNPPANDLYKVDLAILHPSGNALNNLVRSLLTVVEADINPLGYQVIIGTDVLSRLRFVYDGGHTAPSFMLSY
jgi:hypothetical protein